MVIKVLNKINSGLRFLYRKQKVLNNSLRRFLCNVLNQPHFDYASQTWLPNLTKALSNIFQCGQNKCIRFCLQLGNRAHLDKEEFKDTRLNQRICVLAYNFYNNASRAK